MADRRTPNPNRVLDPVLAKAIKARHSKEVLAKTLPEKKAKAKAQVKAVKSARREIVKVKKAQAKIQKTHPSLIPVPPATPPRKQKIRIPAKVLYTIPILEEIGKLAAIGVPDDHIAAILGISYERFASDKKTYPQVAAAWAKGRAQGHAAVAGSLFNAAQAGSFASQTYYLERIHKATWKPDPLRIETANTNINVEAKTQQLARLAAFIPRAGA